jgi:CubicO group peptidase (beta-lactamase class C family)
MFPLGLSADEVDAFVLERMRKEKIPGLSLAIVRDGKVAKARGYGLANVEHQVPATETTVYQWASITKTFTGAAIQMMAVEGKLNVDDRLAQYYEKSPAAWQSVTLRHLLTHTSGIKSYTSLPGFHRNLRKDYNGEELISLVRDLPLEFSPGEKHSYSNTGYYLLGYVIEKVSAHSYGTFLEKRIFHPLGMETAMFNDQFKIVPNRATGYQVVDGELRTAEFVSPTQPFAAGALIGTVLDLAKWDAALYGEKLLPEAAREELWTAVKLKNGDTFPYGFGWYSGTHRERPYVAHGGGIPGFSSYIARFTKDKCTIIILMNADADAQKMANNIAGIELDLSAKTRARSK